MIDAESHVHTVQPTRLLNCVGCRYLVVLSAVGKDEPDVGDELVGRHVARVPRRPGLQPPLHDGEVHGRLDQLLVAPRLLGGAMGGGYPEKLCVRMYCIGVLSPTIGSEASGVCLVWMWEICVLKYCIYIFFHFTYDHSHFLKV